MFRENDWVLITHGDKRFLKRLTPKGSLNVRKEVIKFSEVIGKKEGHTIGNFAFFSPTLEDIILYGFERKTQIVYPKDSFYVAMKLDLTGTKRVLEFGTGSGAMCAVLARVAGEVYSYEVRKSFYELASRNLSRFGLDRGVKLFNLDFMEAEVEEGFFDSAFVDVKDPVPYLGKLKRVLKNGAPVCFLLPTANQVSKLLEEMEKNFGSVEVVEILMRKIVPNPERLRPSDRMVGHTAYLVFGRSLSNP